MIRAILIASLVLWGASAPAQDRTQTLADIRQELSVLYVEIQRLRRELSTTGSPESLAIQGTSALGRIDAIESELQRLTSATEELSNRINRIVLDGTNRLGDLEFRLVELEGGDVSRLSETTTLGGDLGLPEAPAAAPVVPGGAEMAVGEQADFDRAKEAFDAGSYEAAANEFAAFTETYIGGPLTSEAHFWRGQALSAQGNVSGAARAYLESFSGDPASPIAPRALYELGLALDVLGQTEEACVMLGEVSNRFPESRESSDAVTARADLGCT